jgi:hypothetical protein
MAGPPQRRGILHAVSQTDLREELAALVERRAKADAETERLERELVEARAQVDDRQRSFAALAALKLPPASAAVGLGMAGTVYNFGSWSIRDGAPSMIVGTLTFILIPLALALRSHLAERRLLAPVAPSPPIPRARVIETPAEPDEEDAAHDAREREGER